MQYGQALNRDSLGRWTPLIYDEVLEKWVMPVQLTGSYAPLGGSKSVASAGTAEALGGDQVYKKITIIANTTNTGLIYVGDSTVDSTHGLILPAGGCSPDLEFVNTNAIYIDSSVNGEGVSWVGVI